MAWYTIDHACGHTDEHQITGTNTHGEREATAARLAEHLCRKCAAVKRAADRAAQNAAAAQTARDLGWPELQGSINQVPWAETIRAQTHADFRDRITRRPPSTGPEQAAVQLYEQILLRQTSAAAWIDHRGDGWKTLVRAWMTDDDRAALQCINDTTDATTEATSQPVPEPVAPAPVAATDWWVRARLRVVRPARYEDRTFTVGEELTAVQYGWAGYPFRHEAWWLTTPDLLLDRGQDVEDIPVVTAENVEVIEVLDRSRSREAPGRSAP